jgi:hypothetical protein
MIILTYDRLTQNIEHPPVPHQVFVKPHFTLEAESLLGRASIVTNVSPSVSFNSLNALVSFNNSASVKYKITLIYFFV